MAFPSATRIMIQAPSSWTLLPSHSDGAPSSTMCKDDTLLMRTQLEKDQCEPLPSAVLSQLFVQVRRMRAVPNRRRRKHGERPCVLPRKIEC
eukprot:1729104-Rhodomonas_salina.5